MSYCELGVWVGGWVGEGLSLPWFYLLGWRR